VKTAEVPLCRCYTLSSLRVLALHIMMQFFERFLEHSDISIALMYIIYYSNLYVQYIAHLRQEFHNSKFGIFELLVQKETFSDALLMGTVP
jgi:hypothetical protein